MPWKSKIENEVTFEFTRSGGAGGQHVNRTESAVIIRFPIAHSKLFSDKQKSILFSKLSHRITQNGDILLRSEQSRERLSNKKLALEKLIELIEKSLHVSIPRIKTRPTKSSQKKRLESKKIHSTKKHLRSEKW